MEWICHNGWEGQRQLRIVSEELVRYRLEGQSYEDTVNELECKMNMYLNESDRNFIRKRGGFDKN